MLLLNRIPFFGIAHCCLGFEEPHARDVFELWQGADRTILLHPYLRCRNSLVSNIGCFFAHGIASNRVSGRHFVNGCKGDDA